MFEQEEKKPHPLRKPCPKCGCDKGYIETRSGQDCVFCSVCGKHQYNAPKVETGREVRSVTTVHNGIKPQQRGRVLLRAGVHCELCGKSAADSALHVDHLLSVSDGLEQGLTEVELNNDENLAALCDECNLGKGRHTVSLRLLFSILKVRLKNNGGVE